MPKGEYSFFGTLVCSSCLIRRKAFSQFLVDSSLKKMFLPGSL